jgi:hypothetical protein
VLAKIEQHLGMRLAPHPGHLPALGEREGPA